MLVMNLLQSLLGRAVQLEFHHIDNLVSLQDKVNAPFARMIFHLSLIHISHTVRKGISYLLQPLPPCLFRVPSLLPVRFRRPLSGFLFQLLYSRVEVLLTGDVYKRQFLAHTPVFR